MHTKDKRWINQTGLNLIRIVIGSYFAAVALGLVVGVNQSALFLPFATPVMADVIGSTLLILASLTFMAGIRLRLSALILALFVFASSLVQNFLLVDVENVSAFWRDLTMVCAVILTYSNMSRKDMVRANMTYRRRVRKVRKIHMPGTVVAPRRVQPPQLDAPRNAPATAQTALELPSFMKRTPDRHRAMSDRNIFAEI